jgi:hypothetical protein
MPILSRNPDGPYYSQGDERAFFEWVNRISCVLKVVGSGPELRIHVRSRRVSHDCLRELIALFHRYQGAMRQLAQFENPSNRKWFRNPSAYWYRSVFSSSRPSNGALQPTSRARKRANSKRSARAARG